MPGWVEDARELPDPVPPGHGEPGEGAARPGRDAYCWCGRPLEVVASIYRSCSQHGAQEIRTDRGWEPLRADSE